jgi:hypothetical protein
MEMDPGEMAVSVHLVGGIWGLISAGLLASKGGYEDTYADAYEDGSFGLRSAHCMGVFYGGNGSQLTANCLFILAVLSWTICSMIFCIGLIKLMFPAAFKEEIVTEDHKLTHMELFLKNKREFRKGNDPLSVDGYDRNAPFDNTELRNSLTNKGDHNNDFFDRNGYSWDYALVLPVPSEMQEVNKAIRDKKKKKIYTELYITGKKDTAIYAEETLGENGGIEDGITVVGEGGSVEEDNKGGTVLYEANSGEKVVNFNKDLSSHENRHSLDRYGSRSQKFMYGCGGRKMSAVEVIKALHSADLETYQFYSLQRDEIIIKVRVSLKVLRLQADLQDYMLLLDEEKSISQGLRGDKGGNIGPFLISHGIKEGLTSMRPHQHIYAPYDRKKNIRDLFRHTVFPKDSILPPKNHKAKKTDYVFIPRHENKAYNPSQAHPFSTIHRIRLLKFIMEGFIYMSICMYVYICKYTYLNIYNICIYIYNYIFTYLNISIYMYIYMYIYIYIDRYRYAYIYIHIYTYIYIYIYIYL